MISPEDKRQPRPSRWKPRERITAHKLNEGVDAIRQMQAGIPMDRQVDYPAKRAGGSSARFRLKSVEDDHLVCRDWDGTTEGDADVFVAKPWLLRVHPFDDEDYERAGETYEYWSATTRGRTDPNGLIKTEAINPKYVEDDEVYATPSPTGGTGVEDCEWMQISDSRIWALSPHLGGFVIGGMQDNYSELINETEDVKAYVEDGWSARTPQPAGEVRDEGGACTIGDSIYTVGPHGDHGQSGGAPWKDRNCWRYHQDGWSLQGIYPYLALRDCVFAAVGGSGYLLGGGYTSGGFWFGSTRGHKLTAATGTWATLGTNLPSSGGAAYGPGVTDGHMRQTASAVGTDIYMVGGYKDPDGGLDHTSTLDTTDDTWTTGLDTLLQHRQSHAQLTLDGEPYVFGGHKDAAGGSQLDSIERYNVDGDAWIAKTAVLNAVSREMGAFRLQTLDDGDRGYITGGWNDVQATYHHETQRYKPALADEIVQKTPVAESNKGRRQHLCATLE